MSEPMSGLFGGGGSGGGQSLIQKYRLITISQTITAEADGLLDIFVSAGSGGGAVGFNNTFLGGAGAGEVAVKRNIPVTAGDSFVVTLGAGGASVSRSTAGFTAGNNGNNSTIVGPGVNILVNGGKGATGSATKPVFGGLGGTGGTGGDFHYPGGDGGDILAAATATYAAAGGGAVAAIPTTQSTRKGGSITTGTANHAGGAGVGGIGVSSTASASGGGGSGGAGDAANGGANFLGSIVQTSPAEVLSLTAGWGLDVFGGGGGQSYPGGPGGGGAGAGNTAANTMPGIFGGGGAFGGVAVQNLSALPSTFGTGRNVVAQTTPAAMSSGGGGSGMAIFIFKEA